MTIAASATSVIGTRPMTVSGSPQNSSPTSWLADQAVGADGRHREERPEQAAEPERGREQAGPALAHPQQLDRGDDAHRVEQAARHDLAPGAQHRPRAERSACGSPGRRRAGGRPRRARARRPRRRRRLPARTAARPRSSAVTRNATAASPATRPCWFDAHEDRGDERPDERPDALARAPDRVRGDQLLGAAGDGRHQRRSASGGPARAAVAAIAEKMNSAIIVTW